MTFPPRRRNASPEYHLQVWYASYLRARGVLFCPSLAGLIWNARTGARAKMIGYSRGFPDVFVPMPKGKFFGLFVELKVGGRATPAQLAWQKVLNEQGYLALIVPHNLSYSEAQAWLEAETSQYLNLTAPPATIGGNQKG